MVKLPKLVNFYALGLTSSTRNTTCIAWSEVKPASYELYAILKV
jgi:hypothetical protein